jgi:DNA processing protein
MQGMDPIADRALLAALGERLDLPRGALCRLAAELPIWRDLARPDADVARKLSMDLDTLSRALDLRAGAAAAEKRFEREARKHDAALFTLADEGYPPALRQLSLPPPAVFVAGRPEATAGEAVAIVGSRRASAYGVEVATWLATELARAGLTVVSGFARGIDAAAHRGALAAAAGRTVAVLGCGLAHDYPRGQRPLASAIRERGALLSEFPCDAAPLQQNFPVRNRIIAALARATVVVEAAPKSGSLITARYALDAGREVLAVPGRITDELALGTNELLRDGATPVTHPADVLDALTPGTSTSRASPRETRALPADSPAATKALYAALDAATPRAPESLADAAALPVERTLALLLDLELSGYAVREAGGGYRRR